MKVVYLCGKMSGLNQNEVIAKRVQIKHSLEYMSKNIQCFNPAAHYNYDVNAHKSEREIFEYELFFVKHSDVVLADLKDINQSVGSIVEITTAYQNGIPVIGYGDTTQVHPWILEMMLRTEENAGLACEYISKFFGNA